MLTFLSPAQTQDVAKAIAAKDFARAISLRDPEFEDCLHAFRATTRLNETYRVPVNQRMRIAIIQCAFRDCSPTLLLLILLTLAQHWSSRRWNERCDEDCCSLLVC
jgi:hypothetical protein